MSSNNNSVHADHPVKGWYRFRQNREARWEPACIWADGDRLVCRISERMVDPVEVWTFLAKNKVDKDAAKFAFENGYWPNDPAPIPARSNMPDDPFEALKIEAEDKQAQADAWLKAHTEIKSHADCDLARNMQAKLLELNGRADEMFEGEKSPIRKQGKAVDDKYRFREAITDTAALLRKAYVRFMAAEEERQKAEAAAKLKADQERVAAERARIEADQRKKLADDPVAALTSPPPELPVMPLVAEPVKVQAGGGVGRKVGLKSVWVPDAIDYKLAVMHFIDHPDLKAVLDKLIRHVVKDSKGTAKVPGVIVKEDRQAA